MIKWDLFQEYELALIFQRLLNIINLINSIKKRKINDLIISVDQTYIHVQTQGCKTTQSILHSVVQKANIGITG